MKGLWAFLIILPFVLMGLTVLMVMGACTFGSQKLCTDVLMELRK